MDRKAKKASVDQKLFLVKFMEENVDFAYDRFECAETTHKKYKMWQDLTAKLNSISGAFKDANQWRKFWTDQKLRVKEKDALLKSSFQRSYKSGFRKTKALSPYESRVLSLSEPAAISEDAEAMHSKAKEIPTADSESVDMLKEIKTSTQVAPSVSAKVKIPLSTLSTSAKVSTDTSKIRKRRRAPAELTLLRTSSTEEQILKIEEEKLSYLKKIYDVKRRKMEWQKEFQTKGLLLRERELNLREKELEFKVGNNNV